MYCDDDQVHLSGTGRTMDTVVNLGHRRTWALFDLRSLFRRPPAGPHKRTVSGYYDDVFCVVAHSQPRVDSVDAVQGTEDGKIRVIQRLSHLITVDTVAECLFPGFRRVLCSQRV